ncbi:MAG TPA: BrnA antitoxin family protein [Nitrospiraceae bacterium]|nr:BrnA antitoxin family protein [Nitrospiraceae bacterium]
MKRTSESSVRGWRIGRKSGAIKRRKIDYSDIPPLSDKQLALMRRVGRPPLGDEAKQLIAIRLAPRLLAQLRKMAAKQGKPYQTLIHELLEKATSRAA